MPPLAAVSADAAGELLYRDILTALQNNEPTVVKYPAGTGKSYQSARAIAAQVNQGFRVVYATQEHAVAHETKRLLPAELQPRAVHIHSPLIQVGEDPVCQRKDELLERVFEYGHSLQGRVCPRCPFQSSCLALAAAKDRAHRLPEASVVFVSHAGISQVIGHHPDGTPKGQEYKLIVDEMPGAYKEIAASATEVRAIADGAPMTSASASSAKLAQEIARAWLAGEPPGVIYWGAEGIGNEIGNATELAQQWGRLSLRDRVKPPAEERPLLRAADALIRLCAHRADGGAVLGVDTRCDEGVRAMLPDPCHEALVARRGVLLSATPLMQAMPGFRLAEQAVRDGARVRRVLVLREARGSGALTRAYYDDSSGTRVVCRDDREEPGVPWELVDEALARARAEAARYDCKRILFVTFMALADQLRRYHGRLSDDVVVAHFGALRGKNTWMEAQRYECSVVYCFGTPRFNMLPTIWQLGLVGEAADQAWRAYAAGELAQAEGRLRLPRRTKPCTVIVEGDVAPLTWHPDILDEVIEAPSDYRPASALLAAALEYRDLNNIIAEGIITGADPGREPPVLDNNLESLALPEIRDGVAALAAMSPGRRARLEREFTWAPQD